jgi:hypothetical protein
MKKTTNSAKNTPLPQTPQGQVKGKFDIKSYTKNGLSEEEVT